MCLVVLWVVKSLSLPVDNQATGLGGGFKHKQCKPTTPSHNNPLFVCSLYMAGGSTRPLGRGSGACPASCIAALVASASHSQRDPRVQALIWWSGPMVNAGLGKAGLAFSFSFPQL